MLVAAFAVSCARGDDRRHGSAAHAEPARSARVVPTPAEPPAGGAVSVSAAPATDSARVAPPLNAVPVDEEAAAFQLARAHLSALGRPPAAPTLATLWAHWAHETARGARMFGNNFGGLKGHGPDGATVELWTREQTDAGSVLVRRWFRAYPTVEQGALDYIRTLATRFGGALRAARYADAETFVTELHGGGYFTDDPEPYERAIRSLLIECSRRRLADSALERLRGAPPPD